MLLERAGSALREDLAPGRNPANLDQSRVYLELSDLLCRAKGAAEPVQLLRFYCTSSLMGKLTLGRLDRDSRAFFIASLAGALAACSRQKSPESSELASMRRQVVDALSVILPVRLFVSASLRLAAHVFVCAHAVFHPISPVGRASVGVVRNSITNMPAGWWTVTLRED